MNIKYKRSRWNARVSSSSETLWSLFKTIDTNDYVGDLTMRAKFGFNPFDL